VKTEYLLYKSNCHVSRDQIRPESMLRFGFNEREIGFNEWKIGLYEPANPL
jgi:hypothetical protein